MELFGELDDHRKGKWCGKAYAVFLSVQSRSVPCCGYRSAWRPEFNVMQDPDAARAVLESGAEIWQTPQNVYATLEVTLAELKRSVWPCGKISRYLYEQLEAENHVEYNPQFMLRAGENWILGDNTTIAVLLMSRYRECWHMEHAPSSGRI